MKNRTSNTKFLTYILVFTLLLSAIAPMNAAIASETNPNEALIVFGEELETTNVKNVELTSPTMATTVVLEDGTTVWRFTGSGTRAYVYIDLPNSFGNSLEDGSAYDVEVKYFDTEAGYAIFWYDAAKWGKQVGYELYATATSSWKTAKFTLDNAAFKNGVDGKGDIMMSFMEKGTMLPTTPSPVNISSIKITRRPKANPVLAESYVDRYGNVFEWYNKDKTVHNEIKNTSNIKQNINVEYSLVDYETGDKVFVKNEKMTVPARRTMNVDVNIDSDRCGLYNWYVHITNDEGTIDSTFKEDTIAIIKTDPDGIRCEFQGIQTHPTYFRAKEATALLELISMANFNGIRVEESEWKTYEATPGTYVLRDNAAASGFKAFQHANELGLDVLVLIRGGHWYYEGHPTERHGGPFMMKTEEAYDAYEKFLEFIIPKYAPYTDKYEIWNEPNITSFNNNGGEPENLVEITKRARKVIDKYDPGSEVIGGCVTEIYRSDGIYWRDGLLENGIIDGDKGQSATSIHMYHWTNSPEEAKLWKFAKEYRDLTLEYAAKTGVEEMPFYVTEYGAAESDDNTDDEKQTNWQVRDSILYKAHGVGDHLYLHQMENYGIIDTDHEDSFGIVTYPDTKYNIEGKTCIATAPYVAYAGMNYLLGGEITPDGIWELDNEVYMNRFKSEKFGKNILTFWCDYGRESLTLDLGVDSVEYYDRWGNQKTVYGENGIFTFIADDRPSYIIGNFKENRVVNYAPIVEYDNIELSATKNDKITLEVQCSNSENYEAKILTHGENPFESTVKFENGKATLVAEVDGNIGEKIYVDVAVTENEKLISFAQIPVNIYNLIGTELSFEHTDRTNYNKWNGILKLTNYSFERDVDGYIEFSEPAEFAELGRIPIGNIPHSTTKDVVFEIPNLVKKGFKNISYRIVNENAENEYFDDSLRYDFNIAAKPPGEVVIDGIASEGEWIKDIQMEAIGPENYINWGGFECKGPQDISANVSIMWDEENVYMYSEVIDDIYYQIEEVEESFWGDGIQFALYIDTGYEEQEAIGQPDRKFHEYSIAISPTTNKAGSFKRITQDSLTTTGEATYTKVAAVRRGNLTCYEWSMPWEKIVGMEGWSPKVGEKLGFSILWNDNDGEGRKGWVEYAGGIGSTKNKKLFTNLLFIE